MALPIRILVVGAGPTGLTAGLELARLGINADIIERHDTPSNLSRAVGILPSSMKILTPSDVATDLRRAAVCISDVIIHRNAREVARIAIDRFDDVEMRLLALAQDKTEAILRKGIERYGGKVRFGAEFTCLSQIDDGVQAIINGKSHTYDYVIGADGVNSAVRNALGLRFDGFDLPQQWSIADVEAKDWPDPTGFKAYFVGRGEAVIVVPLEANRFRVISTTPDALDMLPVPMNITNLRRAGAFTISVRQVERYQQGRVFLAGDAAHCHSPVGGRGMNLGISDAAELARRFHQDDLEGYHESRHAFGAGVIKLSERGRKVIMSPNTMLRGGVLKLLSLASRFPAVRTRIVMGILN